MEIMLRVLVMPVSLVASVVFCLLMRAALLKWPKFLPFCSALALVGVLMVGVGILISIWPGAAYLNNGWPILYGIFYRVCFIVGPPMAATLLIADAVKKRKGKVAAVYVPSGVCFVVCIVFLLGDIAVYEAVFGPG